MKVRIRVQSDEGWNPKLLVGSLPPHYRLRMVCHELAAAMIAFGVQLAYDEKSLVSCVSLDMLLK